MLRDLSARLPVMLLPRWLESRTQPIAMEDVIFALVESMRMPLEGSRAMSLPGPEVLSCKEMLFRVARLQGSRPLAVNIPILSPRMSSYWVGLITRSDDHVARELVEGLRTDLVAPDMGFWTRFPDHQRLGFDEAARRSIDAEQRTLSWPTRLVEGLIQRLSPAAPFEAG